MPNGIEDMINKFKEEHKNDMHIPYLYSANSTVTPVPMYEMMSYYNALSKITSRTPTEINESQQAYDKLSELLQKYYEMNNTIKWPYEDAPYFTDKELTKKIGIYTENMHRNSNRHYSSFKHVPSEYRNKVKEIQELIKATEDPDEIARLKDELLALGWNPEVEYNPENVEKAKERITNEYNKELHEFSFMNLTDAEINWYIEHAKQAPPVDLTPVVLCLYENGLDVIQPYKIPVKESKEIVDIYVLSIGSAIKDEPNVLTETSIFVLPTNLRAARIAKLMYFASGIDIAYPKPIIQRIYHGPISEADESKLNEFINKSFTYNPIDNPAILFENAPAWISLFNN